MTYSIILAESFPPNLHDQIHKKVGPQAAVQCDVRTTHACAATQLQGLHLLLGVGE